MPRPPNPSPPTRPERSADRAHPVHRRHPDRRGAPRPRRHVERFAVQARAVVAMRPHVDLVVVPELLLAAPGPLLVEDPEFDVRAATTIPGPVHRPAQCAGPRARRVARARLAGRARRVTGVTTPPSRSHPRAKSWRATASSSRGGRTSALEPGSEFVDVRHPRQAGASDSRSASTAASPRSPASSAWLGADVDHPADAHDHARPCDGGRHRHGRTPSRTRCSSSTSTAPTVGRWARASSSTRRARSCSTRARARRCSSACSTSRGSRSCASTAAFGLNRPWAQLADQCALVRLSDVRRRAHRAAAVGGGRPAARDGGRAVIGRRGRGLDTRATPSRYSTSGSVRLAGRQVARPADDARSSHEASAQFAVRFAGVPHTTHAPMTSA